ncbi:MerR family transcriptional regulator [Limosilactobacillus walteri]|uniref:MerR family transcriptional regulator n=1 Tax=Limosilactobacillus walteri TaxID=2268022 RepID=A0ABR8P9G9_9LACO|nr:MerR family transcriptional regulator [Limosilactobacillus walteri]MBD5807405.1 MerR family transcriptional regulator [Limosilactobacillus walteri]
MVTAVKTYSIGEVSKITGLPSSTIRYYDSLNFLPYLEKSPQGIRKFTQRDIDTIRIVECLKKSGLTLKEIQAYTKMIAQGDRSIVQRRELFYTTRQRLLDQMHEMKKTLKMLDFKCEYYDRAIADGTEKYVSTDMQFSKAFPETED